MTVMVDELRSWGAGLPWKSCHMTTDGDLDELHDMAQLIGMRRSWFHDGSVPHYDLSESKRELALGSGAVFVPAREQAEARIAKRRAAR